MADLFILTQESRKCFSNFEKELLLELVKSKISIIENKKTNKVSQKEKLSAWKEVETNFNSTPGVIKRSGKQLIQCYRNMKKRAIKAARSGERVSLFKTEGGTLEIIQDSVSEKLVSMNVLPTPTYTEFDCDATYCTQKDDTEVDVKPSGIEINLLESAQLTGPELPEDNSASGDIQESDKVPYRKQPEENNLSTNTQLPDIRSSQISTPIRSLSTSRSYRPKYRFIRSQKKQLVSKSSLEAATALAKAKTKAVEEQHKLTLSHMQEEHDIKLKILEKQLSIQDKILNILHNNPSLLSSHIFNTGNSPNMQIFEKKL